MARRPDGGGRGRPTASCSPRPRKSARPLLPGSPQQARRGGAGAASTASGWSRASTASRRSTARSSTSSCAISACAPWSPTGVSVNVGILGLTHRGRERRLPGGDPARGGEPGPRTSTSPRCWSTRCACSRRLRRWSRSQHGGADAPPRAGSSSGASGASTASRRRIFGFVEVKKGRWRPRSRRSSGSWRG